MFISKALSSGLSGQPPPRVVRPIRSARPAGIHPFTATQGSARTIRTREGRDFYALALPLISKIILDANSSLGRALTHNTAGARYSSAVRSNQEVVAHVGADEALASKAVTVGAHHLLQGRLAAIEDAEIGDRIISIDSASIESEMSALSLMFAYGFEIPADLASGIVEAQGGQEVSESGLFKALGLTDRRDPLVEGGATAVGASPTAQAGRQERSKISIPSSGLSWRSEPVGDIGVAAIAVGQVGAQEGNPVVISGQHREGRNESKAISITVKSSLASAPAISERRVLALEQRLAQRRIAESGRLPFPRSSVIFDDGVKLVVSSMREGFPTREYYINDGEGLVFAGWERASVSSNIARFAEAAIDRIDPIRFDRNPTVLGLGQAGGEAAFKELVADHKGAAQLLAELLISQIQNGIVSIEGSSQHKAFNSYLATRPELGLERIEDSEWRALLKKIIGMSVGGSPMFSKGGILSRGAILENGATTLGIDPSQLYEWQDKLELDAIGSELLGKGYGQDVEDAAEVLELFEENLRLQIAVAAVRVHDIAHDRFAIRAFDETELQREVARLSNPDSGERRQMITRLATEGEPEIKAGAHVAVEYLKELYKNGRSRIFAGRALALIVTHSELNDEPQDTDPLIPRWSALEIDHLFAAMSEANLRELLSHADARRYLSPRTQRRFNRAVGRSNTLLSISRVASLDVADEENFWNAVDESLLTHAMHEMGMMVRRN